MTRRSAERVRCIARLSAPPVTHVGRFMLGADEILCCVGDPRPTRVPTALGPTAQHHALAIGSDDAIVLLDGATLDILSLDLTGAPAVDAEHFTGVALVLDDDDWVLVVGSVQDLRRLDPAPAHILRSTTTFWVALSQALARWDGERWSIVPQGLGPRVAADAAGAESFRRGATPRPTACSAFTRFSSS